MEKEKFNIKVTEIDNGYRIEISGDEAKDFLKDRINSCCSDGSSFKKMMETCCSPSS